MAEIAEKTADDLINAIRHTKKRAFLRAYAKTANVKLSAKSAKTDRSNHYFWLKEDPKYKAAFEAASVQAADMLEDEAVRRAVQGVQKVKFHQGQPIMVEGPDGETVPYVEHEYSDTLLIFLLKGNKPEKFSDKVLTHNVHQHRVTVSHDEGWYGNDAHGHAAETIEASTAGPAIAGEIQGGSVRETVGEDGDGSADGDAGTRSAEGSENRSD